eukprot:TCONS_00044206-protein
MMIHLLNFSKTVWSLCGRVNADLRVLVNWLNANKISLNASKTEFVIFRSPWRQMDCIPRIKLCRKILSPSKSVKYLGVHHDNHLNWKVHTPFIAATLRRANGAISKLCHYVQIHLIGNSASSRNTFWEVNKARYCGFQAKSLTKHPKY